MVSLGDRVHTEYRYDMKSGRESTGYKPLVECSAVIINPSIKSPIICRPIIPISLFNTYIYVHITYHRPFTLRMLLQRQTVAMPTTAAVTNTLRSIFTCLPSAFSDQLRVGFTACDITNSHRIQTMLEVTGSGLDCLAGRQLEIIRCV